MPLQSLVVLYKAASTKTGKIDDPKIEVGAVVGVVHNRLLCTVLYIAVVDCGLRLLKARAMDRSRSLEVLLYPE
jgi:hypothetical protein